MATEGGAWYVILRNASTAADLAAVAGAAARDRGAAAIPVALDTAARNGFRPGTGVTVKAYNPPISGPSAGNAASPSRWSSPARRRSISPARSGHGAGDPQPRRRRLERRPERLRPRAEPDVHGRQQPHHRPSAAWWRAAMPASASPAAPACVPPASSRPAPAPAAPRATCGRTTPAPSGRFVAASRPKPVVDPYSDLTSAWRPTPPACRSRHARAAGTMSITPIGGRHLRQPHRRRERHAQPRARHLLLQQTPTST
jgi:hypothetical protein